MATRSRRSESPAASSRCFFFSSRRRHTRCSRDWSSDVCSSDLGATDVIARVAARYLGETLGQPVVVENRPGAGGSTGSAYAAKQPADGYTLVMMVESSHAVNPNVYAKPAYDPVKDFTPITNIANVPGVMVVSAGSAYKSAKDVSDAARAAPGKLNYGSSGNGGLSHLSGALFGSTTGTTLPPVAHKSLGAALHYPMAGGGGGG